MSDHHYSQPVGGKTRPGPDHRTLSIKISPSTRALIAQLVFTRINANASYDDTTQGAIIRDAVDCLAVSELGKAPKAPPPLLLTEAEKHAKLHPEFVAYTTSVGMPGMPWDQFLGIRDLMLAKGTWVHSGTGQVAGQVGGTSDPK